MSCSICKLCLLQLANNIPQLMLSKNTTIDFEEQSLFVGIDVHKKQWKVQVLGEYSSFCSFSQPADPQVLIKYLNRNFPGASIRCAYEAGFSGFKLYRELTHAGFECLVVHPADVPTSDKEKRTKSDAIDAGKLSKHLRAKSLTGIYVPPMQIVSLRHLIRLRQRFTRDRTRIKNRIKHLLMFQGVSTPGEIGNWTKAHIAWLSDLRFSHTPTKEVMDSLLQILHEYDQQLAKIKRSLVELRKQQPLKSQIDLLRSVPGVGLATALIIYVELYDMKRFSSAERLCSYVGLIPHMASSGERSYTGSITVRGNKWIKSAIIESAWIAIRKDPALLQCYTAYRRRMEGNKAIVRIAKKLLKRIRRVLLDQQPYQLGC